MSHLVIRDFVTGTYTDAFKGHLALWSKQTGETRFYSAAEIDDLISSITKLARSQDLYLALGTQAARLSPRQRGGADTVRELPGFVADIDFASPDKPKAGYPTDADEALSILSDFPLAPTTVVHTGGGLHAHWLLDRLHAVPSVAARDDAKRLWTAFQRLLVQLFRKHGRAIDSVGDLTRNYRIPGTLNQKSEPPRSVRRVEHHPERLYSLAKIRELTAELIDPPFTAKAKRADTRQPPADHNAIMTGCSWYREVVVAGAAACDEPNWYAGASITGRCRDGEAIFHAYSREHTEYNETNAAEKLQRAVSEAGPRTCRAVELDLGHEGCRACPFHGKIKSPILIGRGNEAVRYEPGKEGPIPLGFTREGAYALLDQQRSIVIQASANQLLSMQWLFGMAPSSFWRRQFSTDQDRLNPTAAGEALISACKARGPFNPLKVRGRGVWLEGDRVVPNLGQPVPPDVNHLYLCFEGIPLGDIDDFDTPRLLAFLKRFHWRNPQDALLLLGWLAIAPICGVLSWRPHCFVYGPPRCGKTTVHALAARVLKPLVVSTDGQSSEAGIRQSLGPDSLPVIIDEFESDQQGSSLRGVLRLARSASSAENPVLRGTPEGRAMQFSLRTTFFFCAVNPGRMSPADQSRILLLELLKHDDSKEVAAKIIEDEAHFRELGPTWCAKMVSLAELIHPAIDMFEPLLGSTDRRHRQNISTLLAGAFVALHERAPTEEEAALLAQEIKLTVELHAEDIQRDNAQECLDHLLHYEVERYPLFQWIAIGLDPGAVPDRYELDAQKIRATYGLNIQSGKEPALLIRNGSPNVDRIFRGTRWEARGWEKALKALDGAFSPKHPTWFAGLGGGKARAVGIPAYYIPPPLEMPSGKSDEE